jgi:hypothetical protein
MGKKVSVIELKFSSKPSILEELFCNKLLLEIYLEKILTNPRGIKAGMPPYRKTTIKIIILKLEDYL